VKKLFKSQKPPYSSVEQKSQQVTFHRLDGPCWLFAILETEICRRYRLGGGLFGWEGIGGL